MHSYYLPSTDHLAESESARCVPALNEDVMSICRKRSVSSPAPLPLPPPPLPPLLPAAPPPCPPPLPETPNTFSKGVLRFDPEVGFEDGADMACPRESEAVGRPCVALGRPPRSHSAHPALSVADACGFTACRKLPYMPKKVYDKHGRCKTGLGDVLEW